MKYLCSISSPVHRLLAVIPHLIHREAIYKSEGSVVLTYRTDTSESFLEKQDKLQAAISGGLSLTIIYEIIDCAI